MSSLNKDSKLKIYFSTAMLTMILTLVGVTYNAWRMEMSEDNNNIREAAFEELKILGEMEQIVFALHYDHNNVQGSPRAGWVKVGLINDLSMLVSTDAQVASDVLKEVWSEHWMEVERNQQANDIVIEEIDNVRKSVKSALLALQ